MMIIRDEEINSYSQIISVVAKYEENNIEYYSESDVSRRIIANPVAGPDAVEKYNSNIKSLKNPFREAYYWLKGEYLDLQGL